MEPLLYLRSPIFDLPKVVEPEVVATSPYRFKRPVPVYCGFGSVHAALDFKFQISNLKFTKWCSRQDSHLHWRRSRRRVSAVGLRERAEWLIVGELMVDG